MKVMVHLRGGKKANQLHLQNDLNWILKAYLTKSLGPKGLHLLQAEVLSSGGVKTQPRQASLPPGPGTNHSTFAPTHSLTLSFPLLFFGFPNPALICTVQQSPLLLRAHATVVLKENHFKSPVKPTDSRSSLLNPRVGLINVHVSRAPLADSDVGLSWDRFQRLG